MNTAGARLLITDNAQGRIWEEYVDPRSSGVLPGMDAAVAAMRETLPPVIRRDPRQRYRSMLEPLVKQAIESYRMTGSDQWPSSAEKLLKELALKNRDPKLLKNWGVEGVMYKATAIARHIVEEGEHRQAEQDAKKVTLDWSGH